MRVDDVLDLPDPRLNVRQRPCDHIKTCIEAGDGFGKVRGLFRHNRQQPEHQAFDLQGDLDNDQGRNLGRSELNKETPDNAA